MPPYHDMGLICGVLQPLYVGAKMILMSPVAFVQTPVDWLLAISRYKATISGGPNFAYDLCVRKITPEQLANLDLSSWEVAFNGAEPIRAETLESFATTFEPCGFRREAFYPCYGLAEATLFVSGGRNYYPQDIEQTLEKIHPALRSGCAAAFAVEVDKEERLVCVCEVERNYLRKLNVEEVVGAIRTAVSQQQELQVYGVVLLKTGTIEKTSSGKIQRHACRTKFLDSSLDVVACSIISDLDVGESEHRLTREELLAFSAESRQQKLESYIQDRLARGLKIAPSQLNSQQPLNNLGLDSLVIIEIKNQIEVDLGVSVSAVKFLEDASIANVAMQVIEQLTPENSKPSPGTKPPFFCVHPVMGVVSVYYDLAYLLGKEQPFYGLQSAGITGDAPPLTRIEDMAADYIKGMRLVQPEGPYF